ncbi:S8 family serine peptidase [Xanthovirga aplysinae]|uniref:S8 family serine peptidase n=1 Tax=Xanthovirga aplysinae TaxID=2529853 RepID=UPI0012BD23E6|nr:S8 family serine peptidase [Xanthovirga aplysinae]MTI32833.1 S8 family peptidase [Xanthovirga aplysinae]
MKVNFNPLLIFLVLLFASCEMHNDEVPADPESVSSSSSQMQFSSIELDTRVVTNSRRPKEGHYIVILNEGTFGNLKEASNVRDRVKKGGQKNAYFSKIKKIKDQINLSNELQFGFDNNAIQNVYSFAFEGFSAHLSKKEVAKLRKDPRVAHIIQDQIISLAKPSVEGAATSSSQEIPWGITRVGGSGDGTGKTAWVIDSGIDMDHPDLNVDGDRSISFVTGDDSPDDANGHGTHVAGTIAAIDNDFGVVGVAAGASVVSLRVLGSDGTGDFSWTVAALDYIAANGDAGDVVNMSLGPETPFIDPATDAATMNLASLGVKIAIAAGNSYDDSDLYTPAHNNHQNIYTISALAEGDFFVYFSNYGSPVDYIAPGFQVKSTWPGGGYNTISGTSMASPHVAGILLLGNPTADGFASDAYWEVKGRRATGNYSETDIFKRSVYRPDPDGIQEPIAHR